MSGVPLEGYEIHMGESVPREETACMSRITDQVTGAKKVDGLCAGNVYGTYIHGIFDREEVTKGLMEAIGKAKGVDVSEMTGVDFAAFKETQYDLLADGLRKHLDMEKIYEILNAGVEE